MHTLTFETSRAKSAAMATLAAPLALGALNIAPLVLSPLSIIGAILIIPPAAICVTVFLYHAARIAKPCRMHLEDDGVRCEFVLRRRKWTWSEIQAARLDYFARGLRKPVLELVPPSGSRSKSVMLPWGWKRMSAADVVDAINARLQAAKAAPLN